MTVLAFFLMYRLEPTTLSGRSLFTTLFYLLSAGSTDEGAPGGRVEYSESYYGCFVRDLDAIK